MAAVMHDGRTCQMADQDIKPESNAGIDGILNRHPAVGFAVATTRRARLPVFASHGFADVASETQVTEDTVFRIGSLTKTFTAIAVMQLHEQGLVDLDAPANDYLRAYTLVPADPAWPPATIRHLLTHTAGIPDARGLGDLLAARRERGRRDSGSTS